MTSGLAAKQQQTQPLQEAKTTYNSEFSIKEWLTTTSHKRVGILYIVTAVFFLIVAGSLGMLMRTQLAAPNETFLNPFTYDQVVTLHGLLMILWVLTPLATGLANYVVPLQIGAKDLAFPRLNATSYWMYLFSGVLLVSSFSPRRWTKYRLDTLCASKHHTIHTSSRSNSCHIGISIICCLSHNVLN